MFTILLFYKESPTKAFPSFSLSKTRKDMRRDTHASSLAYMTAGHLHHSPRVTFIFLSNKEIESCFGSHNKLKSGNCCAGKMQSINFLFVSASAAWPALNTFQIFLGVSSYVRMFLNFQIFFFENDNILKVRSFYI